MLLAKRARFVLVCVLALLVFFVVVWLFKKTITDNNCNISTTAIVKQGSFPTEDL